MNPVIQKCVDELNTDTPRIDYIRGMLESLLVMNGPAITMQRPDPARKTTGATVPESELSDEDKHLLNAYERGPIGNITT